MWKLPPCALEVSEGRGPGTLGHPARVMSDVRCPAGPWVSRSLGSQASAQTELPRTGPLGLGPSQMARPKEATRWGHPPQLHGHLLGFQRQD